MTLVPDTSSSNAAAEWIRARWQDFQGLEGSIRDLMHRAAVVAAGSTDPATKETARQTIQRLKSLWDLHANTVARAQAVAGLIPGAQLGAVFAWPAAVIAVALSVAWIWTRYDAEYVVVRTMEEGNVTPEEARRILAEIEGGGPLLSTGQGLGFGVAAGLLVVGALWWRGRGARAS